MMANHSIPAATSTQPAARPDSIPVAVKAATSSSDANSPTIAANDFLTLLVTEMKNQDPTAQTDPNEYINQLVQVNSLEQLIQINQTLSSAASSPQPGRTPRLSGTAPTFLTGGPQRASVDSNLHYFNEASANSLPDAFAGTIRSGESAAGNLMAPCTRSAAQRVALSLSGR